MDPGGWRWRPAPGWPVPPPGWVPPEGWQPPAEWSPAPGDWVFWVPALEPGASADGGGPAPTDGAPPGSAPPAAAGWAPPGETAPGRAPPAWPAPVPTGADLDRPRPPVLDSSDAERRWLVLESWFVMVAFLAPAVLAAVTLFVEHAQGVTDLHRFPVYVPGHPVTNFILGISDYLPVAAVVPLGLLLLARSGQPPRSLGLGRLRFMDDVLGGLGLAAAAFGTEIALLVPVTPFINKSSTLINQVPVGHVPAYYVVYGLIVSATTAVAEEALVNGYLVTRLQQFGWGDRAALILSLSLRTSYHVYYGLGFLLTIPFGFYVTRSFQKHRRLNRCIAAHFLFDAVLTTIAILA
jgi:hypothetical protein